MEKYDFIERLFKDEISDELFFGVRHLEVGFHFEMLVIIVYDLIITRNFFIRCSDTVDLFHFYRPHSEGIGKVLFSQVHNNYCLFTPGGGEVRMGYPTHRDWMEVPPIRTLMGYHPLSRLDGSTAHCWD